MVKTNGPSHRSTYALNLKVNQTSTIYNIFFSNFLYCRIVLLFFLISFFHARKIFVSLTYAIGKETHLKDPPCLFRTGDTGQQDATKQGDSENENETADPSDALDEDETNSLEIKLKNSSGSNHVPLKMIHGYDSLHETSHKMFHGLKNMQPFAEPSIELDDEMSDPSQNEINKLHKSVNNLIKAAKADAFADEKEKSVGKEAKIGDEKVSKIMEENGENIDEDEALTKLFSKFKNLGKVKIIRLKSNGKITNEDILQALKGVSHHKSQRINGLSDEEMNAVSPFLSEDGLTNPMESLGTISKGEDFESQLLSQIPAEEAQRILSELSKPKPPPKIENSDGIKVAGDAGGNLQIMEQNPFSNAIYGTHSTTDALPIASKGNFCELMLISGLYFSKKICNWLIY